jgi:hypothetical protein
MAGVAGAPPSSAPRGLQLLLEQILQSVVIAIPDFLSQVVEQLEHGERLLGVRIAPQVLGTSHRVQQ